jgi:hypothetical protein
MSQWMAAARERMKAKGTTGVFGRKAAAAGETTAELADEKYNAPGVEGKEARFAYVAEHGHGKGGESEGRKKLRSAIRGGR